MAVLLVCGGFLPVSASQVSPRLPIPMSWSGTAELASGSFEAALRAVTADTQATDTLLRHFKLGVINARLGNVAEAEASFNIVVGGSPLLAPLAREQLGDIAAAGGENGKAMTVYAAALRASDLPVRYRQRIFAKIRSLAGSGTPIASGQPWLDEYRRWERQQRLFDAAGLETVCDSLITAGRLAEADSLMEEHLPKINRREACAVVDRIFSNRSSDPKMTTGFIFALASKANGCRNFPLAERMLTAAQGRPDFATAVPAKNALLLSAQIAYGSQQWQKAIDVYKRYNTAYPPESEVIMNIARAYRSLGDNDQMQKWYDLHIRHFPRHTQSQEILWLRAWWLEEGGQLPEAAAAYRRIFTTRGRRTEEAHIRNALCYYRQGMYDSTLTYLTAFQRKYPQSDYLWAGMFWQGKSHAALGRMEDAHRVWTGIGRLEPTDYYAHRARQLMGEAVVDTRKNIITSPLAAQMPEAQMRTWLNSVSPSNRKRLTSKDTTALRRGAAFLTVAQVEPADFFLNNFETNHGANLQLQYDLATAYALAGNDARAFRVARRFAWRIPMGHRERMPLQVLAVLYPPYYAASITGHARRFNVNPLLVSAVMRQESTFNDQIVSPAGAIGLMQVMPATGQGIANELREAYAVDSLYSYDYNIRFGTYYIHKRLVQFEGDYVLMLCAYNAGSHNAIKWRDRHEGAPHDLFVEDIGFFETRGDVKKVMGNYWTYQQLANTPGYEYDGLSIAELEHEFPWVNEW
jgi:soluble lytic murein transglycosylase-like protein/TolA-binding protein